MKREIARYVRVSMTGDRDEDKMLSPDDQRTQIDRLIQSEGHKPGPLFKDIDVSGTSMNRPDYLKAVEWLEEDSTNRGICTMNVSRFARNMPEGMAEVGRLRKLGAQVLVVQGFMTEDMANSPEGFLMEGMNFMLADYESRKIGGAWRRVHKLREDAGLFLGKAPLGYLPDKELGLVPDPETAAVMTQAFNDFARGDKTIDIARRVQAITGELVSTKSMRRRFDNMAYIGRCRWSGEVFECVHEPLVDIGIWKKVQERRKSDSETGGPRRTDMDRTYLASLMKCGVCDRGVSIGEAKGVARLRCTASRASYPALEKCPGFGTPRLSDIEATFKEYGGLWGLDHAHDDHIAIPDAEVLSERLEQVLTVQAKAEADLKRLTTRWAKGDLPDSVFEPSVAEFTEDIENRAREVDALRLEVATAPPTAEAAQERLVYISEAIDTLPNREVNMILKELVRAVRIIRRDEPKPNHTAPWRGGIEILWKDALPAHD